INPLRRSSTPTLLLPAPGPQEKPCAGANLAVTGEASASAMGNDPARGAMPHGKAGRVGMRRFAVEVVREQGYAVFRTKRYINNLGAERIEQEYDSLVAAGCRHFIINFADSPIINSMGLAILLGIIEKNLSTQGVIVFCCLTEVNAETM